MKIAVRPESIKPQAREWLGKGWFHPGQLATSAIVDQLEGMYLSFWTFDATVDARWKAQVGYPRQRRYYDQHDKTWKTRTEIEWRWEEGRVAFHVDDLLVSASSRASSIILERIYPFDLNELVEYKPEFLAGWLAQAYDVGLDQAWKHGKAAIREQARQACYADIPTSNIRNFSMAADFSNESWRYVLLPVYLTAYRFENKTYKVMVNGQTG